MAQIFYDARKLLKDKFSRALPGKVKSPYTPEQKRYVHFRKLWDYYHFDRDGITSYVEEAMGNTFKQETIDKMQFPLYNLTKKVINLTAVAYMEPALRYVVVPKAVQADAEGLTEIGDRQAERDNEIYQEVLAGSNINTVSKEWNRFAKLLTTVYVEVVFRDGKIEYRLHPPHELEVVTDPTNYLEPIEVCYDQKVGDETYTIRWTPTEHEILDVHGKRVESEVLNPWGGVNKYGIIPLIPCRVSIPDTHFGDGDAELVWMNEKINIASASMFHNMLMQSHGQAVSINMDLDKIASGPITGPDVVIEANKVSKDDFPPSFTYVKPDPATEANIKAIDWMVKQMAVMKGLSVQSVSAEVNEQSGVSKSVDLVELRERRQDDIEFLRPFEKRLFDVTRTVWNFNMPGSKISDKAVFGIDFVEPEVPLSATEEWTVKEKKMSMGLYSPVEDMMDEDEGIDRQQAMQYIMDNMAANKSIRKMMEDGQV